MAELHLLIIQVGRMLAAMFGLKLTILHPILISNGNDFNSTGTGDGGFSWYAALTRGWTCLGLSHPFDSGSATQTNLPDAIDNMRTSVMSYTQQWTETR